MTSCSRDTRTVGLRCDVGGVTSTCPCAETSLDKSRISRVDRLKVKHTIVNYILVWNRLIRKKIRRRDQQLILVLANYVTNSFSITFFELKGEDFDCISLRCPCLLFNLTNVEHTWVNSSYFTSVSFFMKFVLGGGGESSLTDRADEGFVSSVNSFVLLQVPVLAESLSAMLAFERFIAWKIWMKKKWGFMSMIHWEK